MRKPTVIVLILLMGWVVPVSAQSPEPDESRVYKTIGDVELQVHLFYPPNHDPAEQVPAIIFFFGGGWVGGNPDQFFPHARYFATRGMLAVSADYRVRNRHATTPFESVEDGKSAVRWVRTHASELGVDPDRIVAGGGSAGGQVAAATGTLQGFEATGEDHTVSSKPQALVLFNPVIDNGPDGYGYERIGERYAEFSPLHNIDTEVPPTILFLGTNDRLIPVATVQDYQDRMQAAGVRCDLKLYRRQPHGFFNYRDGKNQYYYRTVREADRFLRSLDYLTGKPRL